MATSPTKPDYVTALEAAYGAPSQKGFGSAVFYEQLKAADGLEQVALARYRFFVGDLWTRYGAEAWMSPWKKVYTRAPDVHPGILTELRGVDDRSAKMSASMLMDAVDDAENARTALSGAFDDPGVTELVVYNVGDGGAMTGILIAGRRDETSEAIFLIFLLD